MPRWRRASGNPAETSPSPPALARPAISLVTNNTFMAVTRTPTFRTCCVRSCTDDTRSWLARPAVKPNARESRQPSISGDGVVPATQLNVIAVRQGCRIRHDSDRMRDADRAFAGNAMVCKASGGRLAHCHLRVTPAGAEIMRDCPRPSGCHDRAAGARSRASFPAADPSGCHTRTSKNPGDASCAGADR